MNTQNYGRDLILEGSKLIEENSDESKKLIKKGLGLCPKEPVGWFNLGILYHENREIENCIKSYRQGLKYANAVQKEIIEINLAQDLLLNREFSEGWDLYEKRFVKLKEYFKIYIELYGEPWKGFKDKRKCDHLVIIAEQGYGDTLQFCRFINEIEKTGIQTTFLCQEALASLLREGTTIKNIRLGLTKSGDNNVCWCPLMSLAMHLNINSENIPMQNGYIKQLKNKKEEWARKLGKEGNKKLIALHWQGNPNFEKTMYSKGRSIDAKYLNLLGAAENVEFISIQKGKASKDIEQLNNLKIVNGQTQFDKTMNFLDTAGVLANCDLLISADSSVVHLAGALNITTWVALKWVPEWRWGLEGSESNWYKCMNIYRQERKNEWSSVINKMLENLK